MTLHAQTQHSASPNSASTHRPQRLYFSPSDLGAIYGVDMSAVYTLSSHTTQSHQNRVRRYATKHGSTDRSDAFMTILGPMHHAPNDILIMLTLNDKIVKDLFDDQDRDHCRNTTLSHVALGVYNNDTGTLLFPHLSHPTSVIGNTEKFMWRFNSSAFAGSCCLQVEQSTIFKSMFAKMSNTRFTFTRFHPTSYKRSEYCKTISSILSDTNMQCWLKNMVNVEDLVTLFQSTCTCNDGSSHHNIWHSANDADLSETHIHSAKRKANSSTCTVAQEASSSPALSDCVWPGCGS